MLPLLFAAAAGQAVPAIMTGSAASAAVEAGQLVGFDHTTVADPGLPALGSGVSPLMAELAPRRSGLRVPARTVHGPLSAQERRPLIADCRATALCRAQLQYAHLLRAARQNTPAAYGNPPPSFTS